MKRTTQLTRPPAPFCATLALIRADAILREPPARSHIVRPDLSGVCVARFVLPLDLVKPQNRTRFQKHWAMAKLETEVAAAMRVQCAPRPEPLPGRPRVLCCRFSSTEPDRFNDGFKIAIDMLTAPKPALTRKGTVRRYVPKLRLNLIRDDSNRCAQVEQWWEPAPPRQGFGLIEVYEAT